MTPSFERPDLAEVVERLDASALDRLPFGVVRLDRHGRVVACNAAEAALAGRGAGAVLGLDFFADVAPFLAGPDQKGRIDAAIAAGAVDIEMGAIGDCADPDADYRARILSASDGGLWIFHRREP
jgi:photoactive yellow protein